MRAIPKLDCFNRSVPNAETYFPHVDESDIGEGLCCFLIILNCFAFMYVSKHLTVLCLQPPNHHIACHGDSGSPAIWEDYYDQNRAYLMGVLIGIQNPKACTDEWPEGDTDPPSVNFVYYVPDEVQWILDNTGPEVKECLPKPVGAE